jgi:hypothetical protein
MSGDSKTPDNGEQGGRRKKCDSASVYRSAIEAVLCQPQVIIRQAAILA